jgi:hypothetical protein
MRILGKILKLTKGGWNLGWDSRFEYGSWDYR